VRVCRSSSPNFLQSVTLLGRVEAASSILALNPTLGSRFNSAPQRHNSRLNVREDLVVLHVRAGGGRRMRAEGEGHQAQQGEAQSEGRCGRRVVEVLRTPRTVASKVSSRTGCTAPCAGAGRWSPAPSLACAYAQRAQMVSTGVSEQGACWLVVEPFARELPARLGTAQRQRLLPAPLAICAADLLHRLPGRMHWPQSGWAGGRAFKDRPIFMRHTQLPL